MRDGHDIARVLAWKNGNEQSSRRTKRSVLRLPIGRRDTMGELEVLWSERPTTAPMHAARKKALRSLHVALSDVRREQRHLVHEPAHEQSHEHVMWGTSAQAVGRAVLD